MRRLDEGLRDPLRNALLRRVDWRFLLGQADDPRVVDLASGRLSDAARIAFAGQIPLDGTATLAVLDRPSSEGLRQAYEALRPGGELYCEWRVPAIAGHGRARRRLVRAGFTGIQVYWAWPLVGRRTPQFWLPLDSPAALAQFLALRPPRSTAQVIVRRLWWAAVRVGVLTPLCVLARRPPDPAGTAGHCDELEAVSASAQFWLLLTGGKRSINKVAGLPFSERDPVPQLIVKFARVPEAEPGLEREAMMLRHLEREHPELPGIPRVLAVGRRTGRLALAESAIHGQPLLAALNEATFAELALKVTRWLAGLAQTGRRQPGGERWPRVISEPLHEFEREFGDVAGVRITQWVRAQLDGLAELPPTCEHRDCAPWNIVLTDAGAPALLDWESAEPAGLPGLDVVYFLTNAAFVIEGALEAGRTRATYARLLDRGTPIGGVAAECLSEYCERVPLDPDALARLRLLCWIVHCQSDYRHFEMDAGGIPDRTTLRKSVFLGLVAEEFARYEARAARA